MYYNASVQDFASKIISISVSARQKVSTRRFLFAVAPATYSTAGYPVPDDHANERGFSSKI
jgi:hypothetical protein